ncbi:MAG TPA: hypothetical protein VFQ53_02050 [Kofleriaceae bacterium]|nr:hypothetical protein [Kofleriaceae bacterium]
MLRARVLSVILAVVAGACARPSVDDPADFGDREVHVSAGKRLAKPAAVRFWMHQHIDDLRTVQRWLIEGRLADAKALAFMLTRSPADPGLDPYAADSERTRVAARALVDAPDVETALRDEVQVAETCASCHARTHAAIRTVVPPRPEIGLHAWAADRLWDGMIANADAPWRSGLQALVVLPDDDPRADRLRDLARSGLAMRPDTLDRRAALYGKLMVACASCHARPPAPALTIR